MRSSIVLALTFGCASVLGCGAGNGDTQSGCITGLAMTTSPATAAANHRAAPGGNQQQFTATIMPTVSPRVGCAIPTWIAKGEPTWTSSDPVDIQISSAQDATNGTAVCTGATNGAATLTATTVFQGTTLTATSTFTCD